MRGAHIDIGRFFILDMPVGIVSVTFEFKSQLIMGITRCIIVGSNVLPQHKTELDRSRSHMFVCRRATVVSCRLNIGTIRFLVFPTGAFFLLIRVGIVDIYAILRLLLRLTFSLHILVEEKRLCLMGMGVRYNILFISFFSLTHIAMQIIADMYIVFGRKNGKICRQFLDFDRLSFRI